MRWPIKIRETGRGAQSGLNEEGGGWQTTKNSTTLTTTEHKKIRQSKSTSAQRRTLTHTKHI